MNNLLATLIVVTLTCSTAFAGAGAPVPEKPEGGDPSGRPGQILDDAKCQDVWKGIAKSGTLSAEEAAPVVANFEVVDANSDGKVSQDEFEEGCRMGMVQQHASKPAESGGGQTPEAPEKN